MALSEQEAIVEARRQMGLRTRFVPQITGQPGGKVSTTVKDRDEKDRFNALVKRLMGQETRQTSGVLASPPLQQQEVGNLATYDVIDPRTGQVVASTTDPAAAESQGFTARLRSGTDTTTQNNLQPAPLTVQQIFDAFARGGSRGDAEQALFNLGGVWTPDRVKQMLDSIVNQASHAAAEGVGQTLPVKARNVLLHLASPIGRQAFYYQLVGRLLTAQSSLHHRCL